MLFWKCKWFQRNGTSLSNKKSSILSDYKPGRNQVLTLRNPAENQTAKRFRPLARLRLISFRPALVAILDKKPWVRDFLI